MWECTIKLKRGRGSEKEKRMKISSSSEATENIQPEIHFCFLTKRNNLLKGRCLNQYFSNFKFQNNLNKKITKSNKRACKLCQVTLHLPQESHSMSINSSDKNLFSVSANFVNFGFGVAFQCLTGLKDANQIQVQMHPLNLFTIQTHLKKHKHT